MFVVYLSTWSRSIHKVPVKLVKKKRLRLLIYPQFEMLLVVNIDQSTSSFICYTSFKKLKFPQITVNKLLCLFQAWLHFFLFSDLNYWYINTNNTKFDSTCHIVQRHDPQEDIIFIKITKHMTHKITYCQMLASVVT